METLINILTIVGIFAAAVGVNSMSSTLGLSEFGRTLAIATAGAIVMSFLWAMHALRKRKEQEGAPIQSSVTSWKVWCIRVVGALVTLGGIFLVVGNRMGTVSTFPYAGSIVVVVGVLLFSFGDRA
jgi:hypothetical protein